MSEYKYPGLIKLREGCARKFGYAYDIELCEEDNYCPECQRAIETAESIEKEVYSLESHSIDVRDKPYLRKKIGNDNILIADFIYWKDLNKLKAFIQNGERE